MRTIALFFGVCVCCAVAYAADKAKLFDEVAAIAAYDDLADDWKDKAVAAWRERHAEFEKELAELPKKKYPGWQGKDLAKVKASDKNSVTKHLEYHRKNEPRYFPPLRDVTAKGNWGRLEGATIKQVLSPTRGICTIGLPGEVIIDGADFSNLTDGQFTDFQRQPMQTLGTESLKTVGGGTRTLRVIKPLPKKIEK